MSSEIMIIENEISVEDLAFQITSNLSEDGIKELITLIDERMQDFDFTSSIYNIFKNLLEEFEEFNDDDDVTSI